MAPQQDAIAQPGLNVSVNHQVIKHSTATTILERMRRDFSIEVVPNSSSFSLLESQEHSILNNNFVESHESLRGHLLDKCVTCSTKSLLHVVAFLSTTWAECCG